MMYCTQNSMHGRASVRGFTLIELMVAMALSLFLVGGVVLMYASSKAAYLDSNQLSRLQENIRFASDYMVRDIRNAGFRDQLTLIIAEQEAIESKVAEIIDTDDDGIAEQLIVRYAGRGHCGETFDDYRVVENRYFFDAASGELRCEGGAYDPATAAFTYLPERALVTGLTGLAFHFAMADGTSQEGDHVCQESSSVIAPANRCVAVEIGLEFEGLRDLDNAGQFERRFVELNSTFRNSSIDQIYASCLRLEKQAGVAEGTWCP
jgi:prepilin-type N-terminal cleavage/methylation domain-containing protein